MYTVKGRGGWIKRVHLLFWWNHSFVKYVQGEKGVQKFGLFKFTYFMDRPLEQKVIKKRLNYGVMPNDGVNDL